MKIKWLPEPEDHDYPAAASYLELLMTKSSAVYFSGALRAAPVVTFKAKDILRASGLPVLASGNYHVKKDVKKIREGKSLSPLLLVRNSRGLIIADGYHRLCAVYSIDEDADIPVKID